MLLILIGGVILGRSSMQGTSWHYVNRWELKEKDEFEWEEKGAKTKLSLRGMKMKTV